MSSSESFSNRARSQISAPSFSQKPASLDAGFFCILIPMKYLLPILTLLVGLTLGHFIIPNSSTPPNSALPSPQESGDDGITLSMLGSITGERFPLKKVIAETSGSLVLPSNQSHQALLGFIQISAEEVSAKLSQPDSPAREKRRINEVSAIFEDALRIKIDAHPDFTCDFPVTKSGDTQRSGYPDLRVEHLPSKSVAYLDPKLFENKSIKSSFRTFYFEPSQENSKVTEDALHLLIGFPHDGKTREWTFGTPKLVDLSELTVKLKTEFSASNKDLYSGEAE